MDITTPPLPQVSGELTGSCLHLSSDLTCAASLQVSAEVLRVAEHRHRRGLMYPQIYHILTKVKVSLL